MSCTNCKKYVSEEYNACPYCGKLKSGMIEKTKKLIGELDKYARNINGYEYGLPINDDNIEDMQKIILKYFN